MCGIVGYVTSKNKASYEKFFKQALIADVLRGFDSTGVIVGDDKEFGHFKKAVNGIDFLDMNRASKLINSNRINGPAFCIGHNRAATVGNVNAANAHPFSHGAVTGVHNGTLRKYHKLDRNKEFGTDSEAFYYNLAEHGLQEALSNIDGAYCFVWYNEEEGTVNVVRNDERPLAMAKVTDEDTMLFASESGMLRWLADRNNIKIDRIITPKANQHIRFYMDSKDVANFSADKVKVENRYPLVVTPTYGRGYRQPLQDTSYNSEQKAIKELGIDSDKLYEVWGADFEPYTRNGGYGKVICYMTEKPFIEVHIRAVEEEMYEKLYKEQSFAVKLSEIQVPGGDMMKARGVGEKAMPGVSKEDDYVGPGGALVSKSTIDKACKHGCTLCKGAITEYEYDYIDWIDDKPICATCIAYKANDVLEA